MEFERGIIVCCVFGFRIVVEIDSVFCFRCLCYVDCDRFEIWLIEGLRIDLYLI